MSFIITLSECDTIPGRQCMAACFFLLKQFDDVLLYLNSIKSYYYNEDTFNYNYGQAKGLGNFKRKIVVSSISPKAVERLGRI